MLLNICASYAVTLPLLYFLSLSLPFSIHPSLALGRLLATLTEQLVCVCSVSTISVGDALTQGSRVSLPPAQSYIELTD